MQDRLVLRDSLTGQSHPAQYGLRDALVLSAFAASIPAFYLLLTGATGAGRGLGSALYLLTALLSACLLHHRRSVPDATTSLPRLDLVICLAALASAWPTGLPWPAFQWWLRLGLSALILIRVTPLLVRWIARRQLVQLLVIGTALLAISGAGFYWLEPRVDSYADGLWLAFITAATVGYGDLVPSSPASRVFAVFIVLLGYAIFSVVTASIAALFVSTDERGLEREMHADIRALRHEITALRKEIDQLHAGARE